MKGWRSRGMEKSAGFHEYFEMENGSHSLRMTREELIAKIKKMLHRDEELVFLFKLDLGELIILLASLRDLVDREMQRI
jgi:hypothetical protein